MLQNVLSGVINLKQLTAKQAQDQVENQYRMIDALLKEKQINQSGDVSQVRLEQAQDRINQAVENAKLLQEHRDKKSELDRLTLDAKTDQQKAQLELAQERVNNAIKQLELNEKNFELQSKKTGELTPMQKAEVGEKLAGLRRILTARKPKDGELSPSDYKTYADLFNNYAEMIGSDERVEITQEGKVVDYGFDIPTKIEIKKKAAQTVEVISPEGVEGTIPVSQLEEALKQGYKKKVR